MAALRAAGAMPQVFGTITVSDGISMGTEGMKYSLVSREVIADSIETVLQRAGMDGVLAIGGCDKNMPGAMIAFARLDIPAIFVYGGHDQARAATPGRTSPSSASSRRSASTRRASSPRAELDAIERKADAPAPAPAAGCTRPTPCPRPSRPWA